MKPIARLLVVVAGLLASSAAPACTPASPAAVRVGLTHKPDGTFVGAWAYWWCVSGKTVTYEWRAAPASYFSTTVLANLRAYDLGTNPSFVTTPMTLAETDPLLAPMHADVIAAVAVDSGKPKPAAK